MHKYGLTRPYEKELTAAQNKLFSEIKQVFKQDYVIEMTYPELFDVLDRVKLCYQLDMCKRMGLISFNNTKEE